MYFDQPILNKDICGWFRSRSNYSFGCCIFKKLPKKKDIFMRDNYGDLLLWKIQSPDLEGIINWLCYKGTLMQKLLGLYDYSALVKFFQFFSLVDFYRIDPFFGSLLVSRKETIFLIVWIKNLVVKDIFQHTLMMLGNLFLSIRRDFILLKLIWYNYIPRILFIKWFST